MKTVKAGKALEICGVTVTPQWDWTPDYLATVREGYRKPRKTQDDYAASAVAYARWIAARDGVSLAIPDDESGYDLTVEGDAKWSYTGRGRGDIVAVSFYVKRHKRWGETQRLDTIATIDIPNPERDRPQVIAESHDESPVAEIAPVAVVAVATVARPSLADWLASAA